MKNKNKNELIVSKETVFTKIVKFIRNFFFKKDKIDSDEELKNFRKTEEKDLKKEDISVIKQPKQEELEKPRVKVLNDTDYYKMVYKGMNDGTFSVEDLTPDEFLSVMKMQKLEYEVITKKLKDEMDNFEGN